MKTFSTIFIVLVFTATSVTFPTKVYSEAALKLDEIEQVGSQVVRVARPVLQVIRSNPAGTGATVAGGLEAGAALTGISMGTLAVGAIAIIGLEVASFKLGVDTGSAVYEYMVNSHRKRFWRLLNEPKEITNALQECQTGKRPCYYGLQLDPERLKDVAMNRSSLLNTTAALEVVRTSEPFTRLQKLAEYQNLIANGQIDPDENDFYTFSRGGITSSWKSFHRNRWDRPLLQKDSQEPARYSNLVVGRRPLSIRVEENHLVILFHDGHPMIIAYTDSLPREDGPPRGVYYFQGYQTTAEFRLDSVETKEERVINFPAGTQVGSVTHIVGPYEKTKIRIGLGPQDYLEINLGSFQQWNVWISTP